jgi:DNA repair protein RadC
MADITIGAPAHAPNIFTTSESALINCALSLIEEKRLKLAPVLYYMQDFERYLRLRFAGLTNEQGHTLYLNINRELLSAETEFFGDQKSVSWDIRKTVARAIQLGADFVVLAHNHPTNNLTPSDADFLHTEWMERTLEPLKITLLDSFVVTASAVTSIKAVRQQNKERQDREQSEQWSRQRAERSARNMATRAANRAKKAAAEQTEGATA